MGLVVFKIWGLPDVFADESVMPDHGQRAIKDGSFFTTVDAAEYADGAEPKDHITDGCLDQTNGRGNAALAKIIPGRFGIWATRKTEGSNRDLQDPFDSGRQDFQERMAWLAGAEPHP